MKYVSLVIFVFVVYRLVQNEIGRMSRRARQSTGIKESIRVKKAQQKSIVTMFLVLGTLFICYCPYIICWNMNQIDKIFTKRKDVYVIIHYAEVVTYMKPVLNAFVYYYRLKVVRQCCLKRFHELFSTHVHPQINPQTDVELH